MAKVAGKAGTEGKAASGGAGTSRKMPPLKQIWPLPALVLSTGLFLGGLVMVVASKPKPDPTRELEAAVGMVEAGKYDDAIERLNTAVLPLMDHGTPTDAQRREFFRTRARAFSGAQAARGISRDENHRVILGDYERFEKLGGEADASDLQRMAESNLAMDRTDEAASQVRKLPENEHARRVKLQRAIIEHNMEMAHGGGDQTRRQEQTIDLLGELAASPELSQSDSAWVLARQSELLIRAGHADEAAEKIVRRLGRLNDVTGRQQGELRLLLGKAYFQTEEPASAFKHLEMALEFLPEGDGLRGEAGVMLGRLAQSQGRLDEAKERYERVRKDHPLSTGAVQALLGLAEVHSADRDDAAVQDEALDNYAEVVERIGREGGRVGDVTREMVTASLLRRFQERFDSDRKRDALRFASLAESMYKDSEVPPAVLLAIGSTRRAMGDETLDQAWAARSEVAPADRRVADLDAATRAEVKQHYLAAGDFLRRHAMSTVVTDGAISGDSLWLAADSFDRGGDLEEANRAFTQYADGASDDDPRKPEAKFRLGQVFQAMRDYVGAASAYGELVNAQSPAGVLAQSGVWGERAIVPLATSLLQTGDAAKAAQAEALLKSVVEGSVLSPDASGYRDALIALGGMFYNVGRYPEAIERLEQAAARYQNDREIDSIRFRLADAERLEAASIRRTLEGGALPQSQTDELTLARQERLRSARTLFAQVRMGLEGKDRKKLTLLEKTYLRNAQFYEGDCAFDLGDYAGAIESYDAARLKYADDPASLVAMVQIVAAYTAQGKLSEAQTANERARQQLARFPEEAWSNPDLPMERKHWERWLDARTQLQRSVRAEGGGGGGAEQ